MGALDGGPVGPASAVSLSLASSTGNGACPTLTQDRLGPLLCGPPAAYPPSSGGHWVVARSYCVRGALQPFWTSKQVSPTQFWWLWNPHRSLQLRPPCSQLPARPRLQERVGVEGQQGQRGKLIGAGGGQELLFGVSPAAGNRRPLFGATPECSPEESGALPHPGLPVRRTTSFCVVEISPHPFSQAPSPNLPLCSLGPGWVVSSLMIRRVLRSLWGLQGEATWKIS